jgi:hypothetical protein
MPLDLHFILDNYKTHKTKQVQDWLAKHPRLHLHFTPTSADWIDARNTDPKPFNGPPKHQPSSTSTAAPGTPWQRLSREANE